MNRAGQIRVTKYALAQWCANTYNRECIPAFARLLCFDNPGYVRVYCLDDQRVYHMTDNSFDAFTKPWGEP